MVKRTRKVFNKSSKSTRSKRSKRGKFSKKISRRRSVSKRRGGMKLWGRRKNAANHDLEHNPTHISLKRVPSEELLTEEQKNAKAWWFKENIKEHLKNPEYSDEDSWYTEKELKRDWTDKKYEIIEKYAEHKKEEDNRPSAWRESPMS